MSESDKPVIRMVVDPVVKRMARRLDVIADNLARAAQSTDEGMRRIVEGMVRDNGRVAGQAFERPTDENVELSIERTWVGGVEGEEEIWTILIAGAGGQTSIDWHATEQEAVHRAKFLHETLSMVLGFTGLVVTTGEGVPDDVA
jgi:hypothetical protein